MLRRTTPLAGVDQQPHRNRHRLHAAVLAVVSAALVAGVAAPADAVSRWPAARPTNVKFVDVRHTSFVVTMDRTANTDYYRVWVSAKKADLWVSSLAKPSSTRKAFSARGPRVAVTGLTYLAKHYYVRVATVKGTNRRHSGILAVDLLPDRPSVTASATANGVSLRWPDLTVTGYEVTRATDAGFTTGVVNYRHRGRTKQFAPYGLATGTQYWFKARSVNGSRRSAWSAAVTVTPQTAEAGLRVVTYNLMGVFADGTRGMGGRGEVVPKWMTARRNAAAALVRPWWPDVVLVQEGSSYTAGHNSALQVDTFASALGGEYAVARTQGRYGEPDYVLAGSHVVYRTTRLAAVGNGGHWALGNGKWAAFQRLRHRATGAELLAVSVHLTSQRGDAYDVRRRAETEKLRDLVANYRANYGAVPVVYGGDVASVLASWHPYDAPGVVMRAAGAVDTFEAAQRLTSARYNSFNDYNRTPPAQGVSGDRMFVSPGVGVRSWLQLLRLSDGKFVGTIPSDHNPVVADLTIPYDVS